MSARQSRVLVEACASRTATDRSAGSAERNDIDGVLTGELSPYPSMVPRLWRYAKDTHDVYITQRSTVKRRLPGQGQLADHATRCAMSAVAKCGWIYAFYSEVSTEEEQI